MYKPLENTIQHINEWYSLLDHVGELNSFIEIGTHKGGTFASLSEITSGKKISIDYCDGKFGGIGSIQARERNKIMSQKYTDTHFIEGSSHRIETLLKLNELLAGEKVDLLFIDGDHTYAGVLTDYMMYKQFVRQDGFIAFHDIVDSEFHARHNCFVSKLWKKLQGGVEYISPDNTDCTPEAKGMGANVWGGIGVIKNDFKRNVHIFQVIHDQKSIDDCVRNVGNYIPDLILNLDRVNFENAVIRRVYEEYKFKSNDYIGVTSPIYDIKTGLTIDRIVRECIDADVIDYYNSKECSLSVWDVNRRHCTNLSRAATELNESGALDFDLFALPWTVLYCNYWVAKNQVLRNYVKKYLIPTIEFFKGSKWSVWDDPKFGLLHRKRFYPMAVMVEEGMFGTMLSRNKKLKVKKLLK